MILAVWYHTILAFFFAVLALVLMSVVLLQRGRGVGLAGAFGGAGGGTAFGAKTGDVLTWVTIAGAALLLTMTVILNYVFVPSTTALGPPKTTTPPTTPLPANAPAAPGAPAGPTGSSGSGHPEDRATWPHYAGLAIFGADET